MKREITKIPAPDYPPEQQLTELTGCQRNAAKSAAVELSNAFPWEDAVEGSEFWNGVHTRLLAIAAGEPLR